MLAVIELDNKIASVRVHNCRGDGDSCLPAWKADQRAKISRSVVENQPRFKGRNYICDVHRISEGIFEGRFHPIPKTSIVAANTGSVSCPIHADVGFFDRTVHVTPISIYNIAVIAGKDEDNCVSANLLTPQRVVGHVVASAAYHECFWGGINRERQGRSRGVEKDVGGVEDSTEIGVENEGLVLEMSHQKIRYR